MVLLLLDNFRKKIHRINIVTYYVYNVYYLISDMDEEEKMELI
jgi:hypothetical protein